MAKHKNISIICLLVLGLVTSATPAKPASVLLQEGLYAEEIEGDLNAAIGIYEQVIAQAETAEQTAAQATFRIAMCHLKKGEKERAAEYFETVVSKFPQQRALVAKAQEHLAELKPPVAATAAFGPVVERVINDDGEEKHCLIDFDTGTLFSHSIEIGSEEAFLKWIAENRIDAMGETRASSPGLYGFDMAVIPIAAERWETISSNRLVDDLSIAKGGTPSVMSAKGELPATYTFKTREGGMGVVQILEMQINTRPRHFKIRYKMLRSADGEILRVQVVESKGEWWRDEPAVTKAIYEGDDLEIKWDMLVDNATAKRIKNFSVGVLPIREDISDLGAHYYLEDNLAFTVRRTPYGKEWGVMSRVAHVAPKRLTSGEYRVYVCAFHQYRHGNSWASRLTDVVGAGTAKLVVKPRPEPHKFVPAFGPVIERMIGEDSTVLDFETGKVFGIPHMLRDKPEEVGLRWAVDNGIDAGADQELIGFDMAGERLAPEAWSQISAAELTAIVQDANTVKGGVIMPHSGQYPPTYAFRTREGGIGILQILDVVDQGTKIQYKMLQREKAKSPIDLSTPEATIKSFVKAVYDGNLEDAKECISKDGHDYDEFMEMLATESNHPFQAMIKAMDASIAVEITSKDITEDKCKIKWYFTLGRVYYIGDTKMKKGTHQKFDSYLELVGDKWLIRDI